MKTTIFFILILAFSGCKTGENIGKAGIKKEKLSVEVGINKGGITENTDMTLIENAGVDAFTGATNTGMHVGGRVAIPLGENFLESGFTYMFHDQRFTYMYPHSNYFGIRNLSTSQWVVPLTFNLSLFRKNHPEGMMQLKIGGMLQHNWVSIEDEGVSLPSYDIKKWSGGITTGVTIFPLTFDNGSRLGWYVMGYRGSQIYEDSFNLSTFETPGSSYVKTGLVYQFKTKPSNTK